MRGCRALQCPAALTASRSQQLKSTRVSSYISVVSTRQISDQKCRLMQDQGSPRLSGVSQSLCLWRIFWVWWISPSCLSGLGPRLLTKPLSVSQGSRRQNSLPGFAGSGRVFPARGGLTMMGRKNSPSMTALSRRVFVSLSDLWWSCFVIWCSNLKDKRHSNICQKPVI